MQSNKKSALIPAEKNTLFEEVHSTFFPKAPDFKFQDEQEETIRELLKGHDCFLILPTSGGKSLCYQYAALKYDGITIIISPLVRLINDQVTDFNIKMSELPADSPFRKYRAVAYRNDNDGTTKSKLKSILYGKNQDGLIYKLIYISPEKIDSPGFLNTVLKHGRISMVACDEAHCISIWGQDFRPSYYKIPYLIDKITKSQKKRPVVGAFTATATKITMEDVKENLHLNVDFDKIIKKSVKKPNITIKIIPSKARPSLLLKCLKEDFNPEKNPTAKCIVFCTKIYYVTKNYHYILEKLSSPHYRPVYCHSKLDSKTIDDNLQSFMKPYSSADTNGKEPPNILIATSIAEMGINTKDVDVVIHYNIPNDPESYYQQMGRAGRDENKSGLSILFIANKNTSPITTVPNINYGQNNRQNQKEIRSGKSKKTDSYRESLNMSQMLYKSIFIPYRHKRLMQMISAASNPELPVSTETMFQELDRYFNPTEKSEESDELFKALIIRFNRNHPDESTFFSRYITPESIPNNPAELYREMRRAFRKEYAEKERLRDIISINSSKIAGLIRKGDYENNKPKSIAISTYYGADILITLKTSVNSPFISSKGKESIIDPQKYVKRYVSRKLINKLPSSSNDIKVIGEYTHNIKELFKELNLKKTEYPCKSNKRKLLLLCDNTASMNRVYYFLKSECENSYSPLRIRRFGTAKFKIINGEGMANINYFDMMVCDAIYSLGSFRPKQEVIKINDILRCISGDPGFRAYVRKDQNTSEEKNVWMAVINSIEKLTSARIIIDQTDNTMAELNSQKRTHWEGHFLSLSLHENKFSTISDEQLCRKKEYLPSYEYHETPPLYQYSEDCHGQFFTVFNQMLNVQMQNSLTNLKLNYYLAYRIFLWNPVFGKNRTDSEYHSKSRGMVIDFTSNNHKSIFQLLNIETPKTKKEIRAFNHKVQVILDHYIDLCKKWPSKNNRISDEETENNNSGSLNREYQYEIIPSDNNSLIEKCKLITYSILSTLPPESI